MQRNRLHILLFVLLAVLSLAAAFIDLLLGTTSIPLSEVWAVIMGDSENANYIKIITELRLPKIVVAVLAGMALSASGLQMQTMFRNPLAGPYVLGINSGASLGVALFMLALPMLGGLSGTVFMKCLPVSRWLENSPAFRRKNCILLPLNLSVHLHSARVLKK